MLIFVVLTGKSGHFKAKVLLTNVRIRPILLENGVRLKNEVRNAIQVFLRKPNVTGKSG